MLVSLLIRRHQQVAAARIRNVRVAKVSTGPDVAQTPQIAATKLQNAPHAIRSGDRFAFAHSLETVNCHSCHPRRHGDSDQEDKRLDARFCHCHPPPDNRHLGQPCRRNKSGDSVTERLNSAPAPLILPNSHGVLLLDRQGKSACGHSGLRP